MIRSFGLIFLLSSLLAGCADIEPETQGTAFVSMRLEQDPSNQRSTAKGITPEAVSYTHLTLPTTLTV